MSDDFLTKVNDDDEEVDMITDANFLLNTKLTKFLSLNPKTVFEKTKSSESQEVKLNTTKVLVQEDPILYKQEPDSALQTTKDSEQEDNII